MSRHVGVAALGLDGRSFRVVAVLADGAARRKLLDAVVTARSAHGAVLDALTRLARVRTDAAPLDVFLCQQSATWSRSDEVARANLSPRWQPKARAAETPALERALALVAGDAR